MTHSPTDSNQASTRRTVVAWTFVAIQAALLVALVAGPRDETWKISEGVRSAGLGLFIVGVAIGLWAAARLGRGLTPSPLPNGEVDLVTLGPYRWMRHPMYTAVMVMAVAIATRAGSIAAVVLTIALIVLFNVKAGWEERQLAATFPGYAAYKARTPRFLPRLRR
ncbi:MAG: isoprenylcysteine carboxylmethyltransferase family protein [Acidimicrobiia bacterium]|nr:isoprenylcysteine carboxylmethyltransferase family protein [Acidimicrobiia bacterium]